MYVYVVSYTSIKHMQCSDNRGACSGMFIDCRDIYTYETMGGLGGMPWGNLSF